MDPSASVSLHQILGVLRRRRWVLVQTVLIATVAAVVLSLRSTNEYRASAKLLIEPVQPLPLAGLGAPEQTLSPGTAAKLVRTRAIADRVRASLRSDLSAEELLGRVETAADPRDAFVTVTARGDNGSEAAQLANAFARQFALARGKSAQGRLLVAVRAIERQLESLPGGAAERAPLAAQLSQLRTLAALPSSDAQVVDPAVIPAAPTAPRPVRDGLIGLGLGLLLGLALVFALEAFDPRLKSIGELHRLLDAPQLASVPASVFRRGLRRRARREPRAVAASRRHFEPFERLRTSLLVFNAERELKTVLVTSPHREREGKTTVATNLAVSLAKTGLDVCVVDADLRRPRVADHFGLDADGPGLTDLIEGASLKDVVQRFPVPDALVLDWDGDRPARPVEVTVVAAGRKSSGPAELLAGKRMQDVLDKLEAKHDVVVVDCAPILAASDAMPLVARASGTLLVVRLFHTPRASAVRAVQVIDRARGGMLGVVGTGVPARELREEGYGPWPVTHPRSSRVA